MTDAAIVIGGARNAVSDYVTTDQVTIIGNGTASDPVRLNEEAIVAGGVVQALANGFRVRPGLALALGGPPVDGVPTIFALSGERQPRMSGLVRDVGDLVSVQYAGVLELTTAEWDAVTDPADAQVGGLVVGNTYFVSMNSLSGEITSIQPTVGPTFIVRVGIAITRTQMHIGTPFPFTEI